MIASEGPAFVPLAALAGQDIAVVRHLLQAPGPRFRAWRRRRELFELRTDRQLVGRLTLEWEVTRRVVGFPLYGRCGDAEAVDGRWRMVRRGIEENTLEVTDMAGSHVAHMSKRRAPLKVGELEFELREKGFANDTVLSRDGTELARYGRKKIRLSPACASLTTISIPVLAAFFWDRTGGFRV